MSTGIRHLLLPLFGVLSKVVLTLAATEKFFCDTAGTSAAATISLDCLIVNGGGGGSDDRGGGSGNTSGSGAGGLLTPYWVPN